MRCPFMVEVAVTESQGNGVRGMRPGNFYPKMHDA